MGSATDGVSSSRVVVWKVREAAAAEWVGRERRERARRAGERWRDAMMGCGASCVGSGERLIYCCGLVGDRGSLLWRMLFELSCGVCRR